MPLQFILGGSGTGKTTTMYKKILSDASKEPKRNFFYLVPEQFSMETQKDIVFLSEQKGTLNIDVIGFMRLAYRVFEELGTPTKDVLEDLGKSMVIRKILNHEKDHLQMYQNMIDKPGFVDKVKSMISELFQYHIGSEEMNLLLESQNKESALYAKLSDISFLYLQFQKYLGEHYVVSEQLLEQLASVMKDSKLLRNADIYLDGFTGFTPIQYQLLRELMRCSKNIYVVVNLDKKADQFRFRKNGKENMFSLSLSTIEHITELANENEIEILKDWWFENGEEKRFVKAEELNHFATNFFRYPVHSYEKECMHLSLTQAETPVQEVEHVAEQISKMIREQGYRYRDFAIVTTALNEYEKPLQRVLEKYEIPFFLDQNTQVSHNPFALAFLTVLNMIVHGFTYDFMFSYLKTGVTPLTFDEIEELDNYIFATGIRGYQNWTKEFKRLPAKYHLRNYYGDQPEEFIARRQEYMNEINEIRQKVMKPIIPLYELLYSEEKTEIKAKGLYDYFVELEFEQQMENRFKFYESQDQFVEAKVYKQLFGQMLDCLDKLVDVLGEERLEAKDIYELMEVGLEQLEVGVIPPTLDQTMIGDLERSRFPHVKVMFVLGVNDGYLPKIKTSPNLLSDMDRRLLKEVPVLLAPTSEEYSFNEQFYIYFAFSNGSEGLHLSWAKKDEGGNSLRPSFILRTLQHMFPKLKVQQAGEEDVIYTKAQGMDWLKDHFIEKDNSLFVSLFQYYEREEKNHLDQIINGYLYRNEVSSIGKELARKIYGETLQTSITRMERFGSCPYAHFLSYGLGLSQREEYSLKSNDLGSMIHKILEFVCNGCKEKKTSIKSATEEVLQPILTQAVKDTVELFEDKFQYNDGHFKYLYQVLERMARKTVDTLRIHLAKGKFEPDAFELVFSDRAAAKIPKLNLDNGGSLSLRGVIDRVDTFEDNNRVYVKVIDYKTGNQTLDITKLFYGLQLQLFAYLDAAMTYEGNARKKQAIPAGVLYYHAKDPIINHVPLREEHENLQAIEQERLKMLRMNGYVNSNLEVLNAFEEVQPSTSFVSIPITFTKSGELSKRSNTAISNEQLLASVAFAKDKMKSMATKMLDGDIELAPYSYDTMTGCTYCDYHDVCCFDESCGNAYRVLRKEEAKEGMEQYLQKQMSKTQEDGHE